MARRFYRLNDDVNFPNRWHLGLPFDAEGQELWGWEFTSALRQERIMQPVLILIDFPGTPLDYSETLAIPVVVPALADAILEVAGTDIQRFSARVEGIDRPFEIINVLTTLSCVDESRSEIINWTEADGRADRIGEYRMMARTVLDGSKIGDWDLFRIAEYSVILVCSSRLKTRLEKKRFTGLKFTELEAR